MYANGMNATGMVTTALGLLPLSFLVVFLVALLWEGQAVEFGVRDGCRFCPQFRKSHSWGGEGGKLS